MKISAEMCTCMKCFLMETSKYSPASLKRSKEQAGCVAHGLLWKEVSSLYIACSQQRHLFKKQMLLVSFCMDLVQLKTAATSEIHLAAKEIKTNVS